MPAGHSCYLIEYVFSRFSKYCDVGVIRLQTWVRQLLQRRQLDEHRLRREPVLQEVRDERFDPDVAGAKVRPGSRSGLRPML